MTQHQWVELQVLPVTPILMEGTNDIQIEATEVAEEIAKDDVAIVCWHCKVNLDTETLETECEPS